MLISSVFIMIAARLAMAAPRQALKSAPMASMAASSTASSTIFPTTAAIFAQPAANDTATFHSEILLTSNCGLDMYRNPTQSRIADIIDDLTKKKKTIIGVPGQKGKPIACKGQTAFLLSVDDDPAGTHFNVPFASQVLAAKAQDTYADCYGSFADKKAGDLSYIRAYQFWGQNYNLLVVGGYDCDMAT